MAKGARGGRRAGTTTQPTGGNRSYGAMSDADASAVRDMEASKYHPDVTAAIKLYISDSDPNNDGYSHSQNLNYKLDQAAQGAQIKLNPTEKYILDNIRDGMHDIGKDVTLERYCHEDVIKRLEVSNYSSMSESQLKQALIGKELTTTAFTSYSYDRTKNPFRPGVPGGNGREVTIISKTKSSTKVVFGKKSQSEIVMDIGTKQKVTNVYYDGTTAYPRGKGAMPRIVVEIETL